MIVAGRLAHVPNINVPTLVHSCTHNLCLRHISSLSLSLSLPVSLSLFLSLSDSLFLSPSLRLTDSYQSFSHFRVLLTG